MRVRAPARRHRHAVLVLVAGQVSRAYSAKDLPAQLTIKTRCVCARGTCACPARARVGFCACEARACGAAGVVSALAFLRGGLPPWRSSADARQHQITPPTSWRACVTRRLLCASALRLSSRLVHSLCLWPCCAAAAAAAAPPPEQATGPGHDCGAGSAGLEGGLGGAGEGALRSAAQATGGRGWRRQCVRAPFAARRRHLRPRRASPVSAAAHPCLVASPGLCGVQSGTWRAVAGRGRGCCWTKVAQTRTETKTLKQWPPSLTTAMTTTALPGAFGWCAHTHSVLRPHLLVTSVVRGWAGVCLSAATTAAMTATTRRRKRQH